MKRLEILGLLALIVAALLVFAAPASATVVTSEGSVYTGTIEAVNEEGPVYVGEVACDSTIKAKIESHGLGVTAKAGVSQLTFENCTKGWTVNVNSIGHLTIHNASVVDLLTWSGLTITVSKHFGSSCSYVPVYPGSGALFPSIATGGTATIEWGREFEFHSGDISCEQEIGYQASYIVNTPDNLDVD